MHELWRCEVLRRSLRNWCIVLLLWIPPSADADSINFAFLASMQHHPRNSINSPIRRGYLRGGKFSIYPPSRSFPILLAVVSDDSVSIGTGTGKQFLDLIFSTLERLIYAHERKVTYRNCRVGQDISTCSRYK